jgi:hypothetical protein
VLVGDLDGTRVVYYARKHEQLFVLDREISGDRRGPDLRSGWSWLQDLDNTSLMLSTIT